MDMRCLTLFVACIAILLPCTACDSDSGESSTPTAADKTTRSSPASAKPAPPASAKPAPPATAESGSNAMPTGHPPMGATGSAAVPEHGRKPALAGARIEGSTLKLTGIDLTIPDGWFPEPATPGPMAPKAVFKLAGVEGDAVGCSVRITHFPGMKGMDRQNVDRWISQVRQPDGSPSTRDHAKVTTKENGNVRLTIVDITGSVNTSMDGQGGGKPNHRQIAAIVDHPKGPHFVKASGSADSMKKWESSIHTFIESAKAN